MVFQAKGYDAATTREISDCAGVNLALIPRYFGSKKGLFEAAILPELSLEWLVERDFDYAAERLALTYIDQAQPRDFDVFVVLLRSIASEEVGPLLRETMLKQILTPLEARMSGEDARARAILLVSQLAGLIIYARVLAERIDTQADRVAMRDKLVPYLRDLLGQS